MIGLIQRAASARVDVQQETVAQIDTGILALIGVEHGDTESNARRLLERLLNYRIFPDADNRMNLSLQDIQGGLLLVPQFTLVADTRKGTRPGFSTAASPEQGRLLFDYLLHEARLAHPLVESGIFGADMQVSLTNDGPVTFWLQA